MGPPIEVEAGDSVDVELAEGESLDVEDVNEGNPNEPATGTYSKL